MEKVLIENAMVSVSWLSANIGASNIIILDASIPKVSLESNEFGGLSKFQIKNARFVDMKNIFNDYSSEFPNTMLSPSEFSKVARKFGINNGSAIIVYDEFGIYSSPRAWWMFKSMGHDNVAVLNGGLPEWIKEGFEVEEKILYSGNKGNFIARLNDNFFKNYEEVFEVVYNKSAVIIDARSHERFKGIVKEPRKGLRSGHIPTSKNLPYSNLIQNNKMIDSEKISLEFSKKIKDDESIFFSCGSGITACILALGAEIIGINNISVYDGSWTEWGSKLELPIETDEMD